MSEAVEIFRAMKDYRQQLRAAFGKPCPLCAIHRPKAQPKILMPGESCRRVHRPPYTDPRPELTNQQIDDALGTGAAS